MSNERSWCIPAEQATHGQAVYALVAYVPGAFGMFLDRLKRDLHPWGAAGRSHVTVLSPRPLNGQAGPALTGLARSVSNLPPLNVEAAHLDIFPDTNVIYAAVSTGHEELRGAHNVLNAGDAYFQEPFPYHPHITLASGVPCSELSAVRRKAETLWATCAGSRSFVVRRLSFVRTRNGDDWKDFGELYLTGNGRATAAGSPE